MNDDAKRIKELSQEDLQKVTGGEQPREIVETINPDGCSTDPRYNKDSDCPSGTTYYRNHTCC